MDVVYLAGMLGLCALCAVLIQGCTRLHRPPGGRP
ncbi:hypothetical protein JOE11_003666 [Robbsia andropogonis]